MLFQLVLPLCLTAFLSILANAATPNEVAIGKIPGYLNAWDGNPPFPSDYLTTTFCYCSLNGDHLTGPKEEAHYFQYEYYNVHSNTTFLIEEKCKAPSPVDGAYHGCLERNISHPEYSKRTCRAWLKDPHDAKRGHDTFCYVAADVNNPHEDDATYPYGGDMMWFNDQRRELGPKGGQGPVHQPAEMVEEVCTSLCSESTGLHRLDDAKLAPNRVTIFGDLDDMCDGCKK